MSRTNFIQAVAALALGLALASGATPAVGQTVDVLRATFVEQEAKTEQVSTQDVRRILADGSALLLDPRTPAEYAAGHIPGARNLGEGPAAQLAAVTQITGGDKSKALVLYCNGPYCQASRRLAEQLLAAGFTNVRRYQLGIPVWRALGGPTEISLEGLQRIVGRDQTAVVIDARSPEEFAAGSVAGARNLPVDRFVAGAIKQPPLPEDDFNTRIVLIGRDAKQARELAQALSTRPWHNVSYVGASFDEVRTTLR